METLRTLDTRLFLFLNGKHSTFFDPIMYWASDKLFWIPFYCFLLFILIRHCKKESWLILISVVVLIVISDQISSHLIKDGVQRLRPSHEPALIGLIHLSKAGPGGLYGFVSSHAANAFALLTFFAITLDKSLHWMKYTLLVWALLVSYSRIYVGVHYPSDVIGGALVGIFSGWIIAHLFRMAQKRMIVYRSNINASKTENHVL